VVDSPITILVGQVTVTEIGDRHLILPPGTRVLLPKEQSGITTGMVVRTRAREGGQYIAESISPMAGPIRRLP
jgi:hypothetical protein